MQTPVVNTNTDITTVLREIEVMLNSLLVVYMQVNNVEMDVLPQAYRYILNCAEQEMLILPEDGGDVPPSDDDVPVL